MAITEGDIMKFVKKIMMSNLTISLLKTLLKKYYLKLDHMQSSVHM